MSASAPARSIEFHNTTLGATVAVLQAAEPTTLADSLHKMLGGMPDFFNGEAVILDFAGVAQMPARVDWSGLQSLLRRYRLQPIGVMRVPAEHHEGARRAGLALIDPSQLAGRPPAEARRDRASERERAYAGSYLAASDHDVHWAMIRACCNSVANIAVCQFQDVLGLDSAHRMNIPGTIGGHNWSWRFRWEMVGPEPSRVLGLITAASGRGPFDLLRLPGCETQPIATSLAA